MGFSKNLRQKTLKQRIGLSGIGVHSGKPVSITLCPADADSGISFLRTNTPHRPDTEIPALAQAVGATELSTVLGDPSGVCVATVEHLLAAFAGLGVDNALVEIDGAEVPVMDGSARAFVEAIDQAGTIMQSAPRRFLRILRPVRVELGSAHAEFRPYDGFRLEVSIDYDCRVIGRQSLGIDVTATRFREDIAGARTYGYMRDVEGLWAAGFALGSSLDNTVVIGDGGIVNAEGLRYPDEFVRHKALDAIGDLALAGAPIRGLYRSYRGGHKLNAMAVSALLWRTDAWRLDSAAPERESRPAESHGELAGGVLAAAFAPEVL
jgi:UDP-3-O-[3-hydroxymyristoyl] N-acetylglucosamine deacetylase